MKKNFILLIVLAACFTMQAQTPISVPNGDFSSGSTLTGSSPWTSITGWTITQSGTAVLTAGSSGVISGTLTFVGTNSTGGTANPNQAEIILESDKIDISAYAGSTAAFTYAFQIKVANQTKSAAPWNVITKVYDVNNVEVLLAISQTKSQGDLKTTAAGTYVNASVVGTLLGAPSASVKYITIQVHLGTLLQKIGTLTTLTSPTLDNFTLTAAGAAASTTLTQPASTALSYEIGNGPSAEQSFQVAGANLGSNNITVTPGANIELSTASGSGFASSAITLTQSGGTVNTTTLYARLIADKDLGSVGANATRQVNVAATGTTTKTIQFTGNVNGITSSVAGGTAINYIQGEGPSAEKTITVQGGGLTADVIVTPGSNIEISTTTGIGFASTPITLIQSGGAVAATPIYARLIAGLSGGTYNDATAKVTASSTGFTSKEIQFTGAVSANVSATQNISDLALSGAATLNIIAGGELNINQNTSSVTINVQPGGKVTLADTKDLTGSTLTLQSNASGTGTFVDNNSTPATVSATVQQYLPQGHNWYLSIPVSSGNASSLIGGTLATSVSYYDEVGDGTTGAWVNGYSGAMTAGKGYVAVSSTGTGTSNTSFAGTLNSGDIPVTLTRTGSGTAAGFNLVANPYPSYINWQTLNSNNAAANMPTGTMWYRTISYNGKSAWVANTAYNVNDVVYNGTRFYIVTTAGTSAASGGPTGTTSNITDNNVVWAYQGSIYIFATVNADGQASPATVSNLVPPMQAFWVRTNAGGGTLTFKNMMRTHNTGSSNALKAPKNTASDIQLLRLSVTNGISTDESLIYSSANASNAFDTYDAPKYFNSAGSNQTEIYTQVGDEKLVINAMNELNQGTEIPLGFATEKLNNLRISASELKNFASDMQIMLIDKQKNTEFNLTNGQAYEFSSDVVNDVNRFSIIFRAPGVATATDNLGNINAQVFVNAANQIAIVAPEKASYSIYNAVGQLIDNGIVNSKLITHNSKLSAGVYVVKVNNQSTRIIVK
jgi:hypothetical protein